MKSEIQKIKKLCKLKNIVGWSNEFGAHIVKKKLYEQCKKTAEEKGIEVIDGARGLYQLSNPNLEILRDIYVGKNFYIYKKLTK